ncbi:hypothetical protein O4H53_04510 [Sulfitobacter sp. G21635-S1]|uniref:hypothetical protein n=1 Tax=Sulfitobacter sp. G21635-S1 TaxID=3014043 RepID=UPI0022AE9B3D|nr:hypothetical protein [Sulfitobacter sp. G21635-S1]MCZ4254791.1 hypothetical protein [Sulfitobacter sp. G21635-S1]
MTKGTGIGAVPFLRGRFFRKNRPGIFENSGAGRGRAGALILAFAAAALHRRDDPFNDEGHRLLHGALSIGGDFFEKIGAEFLKIPARIAGRQNS